MGKKRRFTTSQMVECAAHARSIAEDPGSPQSDQFLEETVARYNQHAYDFLTEAGLIFHPKWPAWHRQLQVRFLQIVTSERTECRQIIQRELEDGKRPHPDRLLREVFRWYFMEVIRLGKCHKDKPRLLRSMLPKRLDIYWQEAFDSLAESIAERQKLGQTIDQAPPAAYRVLDADYSLAEVPSC